jgi:hypothetical protein
MMLAGELSRKDRLLGLLQMVELSRRTEALHEMAGVIDRTAGLLQAPGQVMRLTETAAMLRGIATGMEGLPALSLEEAETMTQTEEQKTRLRNYIGAGPWWDLVERLARSGSDLGQEVFRPPKKLQTELADAIRGRQEEIYPHQEPSGASEEDFAAASSEEVQGTSPEKPLPVAPPAPTETSAGTVQTIPPRGAPAEIEDIHFEMPSQRR